MSKTECKNLIYPNSTNPHKALSEIKKVIKKTELQDLQVDLSDMNLLDAVKVLVILSSYLYQKLPEGKLKFKFASGDIKNVLTSFSLNNLVMV